MPDPDLSRLDPNFAYLPRVASQPQPPQGTGASYSDPLSFLHAETAQKEWLGSLPARPAIVQAADTNQPTVTDEYGRTWPTGPTTPTPGLVNQDSGAVPMFRASEFKPGNRPFPVDPEKVAEAKTKHGGELAVPYVNNQGETQYAPISYLHDNMQEFLDRGYKIAPEYSAVTTALSRVIPGITLGTADLAIPALRAFNDSVGTNEKFSDLYEKYRKAQQAVNIQRKEINPWSYAGGETVGGVVPGLLSGGGGILAQGAKQAAMSGVQGAAESLAAGESPTAAGMQALKSGTTGALVAPLAAGAGRGTIGLAETTSGAVARQERAAQYIAQYAKDTNQSFEKAAADMAVQQRAGVAGLPTNVQPTLADTLPRNEMITAQEDALRNSPVGHALSARRAQNVTNVAENVRNLAPSAQETVLTQDAIRAMKARDYASTPVQPLPSNQAAMNPTQKTLDDSMLALAGDQYFDRAFRDTAMASKSAGLDLNDPEHYGKYLQILDENVRNEMSRFKPTYINGQMTNVGDPQRVWFMEQKYSPFKDALNNISPELAQANQNFARAKMGQEFMSGAEHVAEKSGAETGNITSYKLNKAISTASVPKNMGSPREGLPALTPEDRTELQQQVKYLNQHALANATGEGENSATFKRSMTSLADRMPDWARATVGMTATGAAALTGHIPMAIASATATSISKLHADRVQSATVALLANRRDEFSRIADTFTASERATFARRMSDGVKAALNSATRQTSSNPVEQDYLLGLWPQGASVAPQKTP